MKMFVKSAGKDGGPEQSDAHKPFTRHTLLCASGDRHGPEKNQPPE